MRSFIERNFTVSLLLGIVAGLYLPGLDYLPPYAAIVTISCVMFFSCSRVSMEEMRDVNKRMMALFIVSRFLVLPVVVYYVAVLCLPDYALGILLLTLAPVAVAATAIANLTGGSPSLSLPATVLTNGLTPLFMPAMILLLTGNDIEIDAVRLFVTLILSVFLPTALYIIVARPIKALDRVVKRESQAVTTVLLGMMVAFVTAMQREYIFTYPQEVLMALVVACILYGFFYGFGWFFASSMPEKEKKTFAICSGTNNIALCAGIAALHFSSLTVVFAVMGEIAWVFAVATFKRFAQQRNMKLRR